MLRLQKKATSPAGHLMLAASVIDGPRRDTSGLFDDAIPFHDPHPSESLRRCAFAGTGSRSRQKG